MFERFDPDWLLLREAVDSASASRDLAQRLAALLPARPRLLDLGSGTGSLFRRLAPIIGRPQAWILVDGDRLMLGEAFDTLSLWAEGNGWTVTWPGRALVIHTPKGAWRVEGLLADLADAPAGLPLREADAVVCSALLDLVSAAWMRRFAAALRLPFLACLTVDGRNAWLPHDPGDAVVAAAFRRDQRRNKGFGPALGVDAADTMHRLLAARNFNVVSAPSVWRLGPDTRPLLRRFVDSTAQAAVLAEPHRAGNVLDWQFRRWKQIDRRKLRGHVGHKDLLAVPATSR